ncbi:YbaB/EbfC family nucleoid-associated protein [Streptomyces sp. NPDC023723]|uniref:YbaB/EbfC family nucleoid-associated protein n=1 Tax=Streptomyces sp. NPDC023723 TaxID=3154323 RepID=UPI0033DE6371
MERNDALDMGRLVETTRQMQQGLARAQQEIHTLSARGTAGGGAVRVTVDSKGALRELTISPAVADPGGTRALAELVVAAVREAQTALAAQHEARLLPMLEALDKTLEGFR